MPSDRSFEHFKLRVLETGSVIEFWPYAETLLDQHLLVGVDAHAIRQPPRPKPRISRDIDLNICPAIWQAGKAVFIASETEKSVTGNNDV